MPHGHGLLTSWTIYPLIVAFVPTCCIDMPKKTESAAEFLTRIRNIPKIIFESVGGATTALKWAGLCIGIAGRSTISGL